MDFIFLYLAALFLVFGILIKKFKFYWLISGYNTASKERREQIDKEGLGRFMGNYFYAMAGLLVVAFLLMWFDFEKISFYVFLLILLSTVYVIIGAQKYDKGAYHPDGRLKKGPKITVGIIIVVILGVLGATLYGLVPTKYDLNQDSLTIKGMYGETIPFKNMKKVELVDSLPQIKLRTNGYALNNVLKGHFKLEQLGTGKLFIQLGKSPYIIIHTDERYYIINESEGSKTRELYEKIRMIWEKSSSDIRQEKPCFSVEYTREKSSVSV